MKKQKLSYEEQIIHLKSKGVTFNVLSETEAVEYLQSKNHYFRVKSYCKNYEKKANGTYIHLDFAYLVELAEIDRKFRQYILNVVIHLEHILKQRLLKDINENDKEDGITIINEFLTENHKIKDSITKKKSQSVCHELINKYENNFSAWCIVEVLSFGELTKLYIFYYKKYPSATNYAHLLHHLKFIRNAVAHNNCLLNTLKTPYTVPEYTPSKEIGSFISRAGVKKEQRLRITNNPVLHDFVTLLYVLINISFDNKTTKKYLKEAKTMIEKEFKKHEPYFKFNTLIISRFNIIEQIIDFLLKKV